MQHVARGIGWRSSAFEWKRKEAQSPLNVEARLKGLLASSKILDFTNAFLREVP